MNLDLSLDQLSILDIGCGVGDVLKWIPRKWKYTGIDVTESYIKLASTEWGHRGKFLQGDASQIDTIIPAHQQANDKKSKQASKEASKQTNNTHTNNQPNKRTDRQASRQASKPASQPASN